MNTKISNFAIPADGRQAQSAIRNLQSAICNLQSAICNLQSAICKVILFSLLMYSILNPFLSSAQFEDYDTWDTVSVAKDGRDTIIYLEEDSSVTEFARMLSNPEKKTDSTYPVVYAGPGGSPIPNTITFGTYSENINQNLFGINVSGMFTQNTLPIESSEEQWQWLSDLAPEMLRFPGGEFAEFSHPYEDVVTGSLPLGYGYNLQEIFRYFDKTDGETTTPTPVDSVILTASDELIGEWVLDKYVSKFKNFIEAYNNQIDLDDDGITEDDAYINQFIKLIQKIETENPGHRVNIMVCLNVSSATPAECRRMVEYLEDNDIYDCYVYGVEMGNEMADDFHCSVMGFSGFEQYYAYLSGSNTYAEGFEDVIIDDPLDADDLYSSHDFIGTFKKNLLFTKRIGVCAAPLPNSTGAVFKAERSIAGCDLSLSWNDELVSHYTDTAGVVDFSSPTFYRMAFDAVILHPYYSAQNLEYIVGADTFSIPIYHVNPEIGSSGFGYECIDPTTLTGGKWRYDIYDERLRGAFDGDTIMPGIKTNYKNFMKTEYKSAYDQYNLQLQFNLSLGLIHGGKYLWTTEYNIKDEDRNEDLYNNKLIQVYTNGFMHGMLLQEWGLKNLKLNFQSGYRKNFFSVSTLQNYVGGAGKDMLTPADNSELYNLGFPFNTSYYTKRIPYQAMLLLSEITKQNLKYLPSTYGIPAIDINLQPTSFIDPSKENIYVYYSNVGAGTVNYKLNTENLTAFFPGSDYVNADTATLHYIKAEKIYSTLGRSTLFEINECYDGATYMEDALHPWEMQQVDTVQNIPACSGGNLTKCITVPAYSFGFFKVPLLPHYPEEPGEGEGGKITLQQQENSTVEDIELFPNPADAYFVLSNISGHTTEKPLHINIINLQGSTCLKIIAYLNQPIDINILPAGIYQVQVNNTELKKLVKQ